MGHIYSPTRRAVVAGFLALPLIGAKVARAESLPTIRVTKDPSCGCCGAWVDHVRAAGFTAEVIESRNMNRLKVQLGIPDELASCHTAEVGGYVIEGHVPASVIKKLLVEKPQAKGLAVPGMPVGSPGMEVSGVAPDTYDVVLFGPTGRRAYARFRGTNQI